MNELARQRADNFINALPLPGLNLVKQENSDPEQMQYIERGYYKFDANSRTLYLKQIPVFISRFMLKEEVQSVTRGLEQIIFSEPLKMQNHERYSWLVYESEQAANEAIPLLEQHVIRAFEPYEDFKLSPIKNNQTTNKAMRILPELPADHLARDIDLCKRLISEVFDAEKEIEFSE